MSEFATATPTSLRKDSGGVFYTSAERTINYRVSLEPGLLTRTIPPADAGERATADPFGRVHGASLRRLVIIDATVDDIYGTEIRDFMDRHHVESRMVRVSGGESSKSWSTVRKLCRAFDEFGLDRRGEPVIIIGGGVILDAAGFAATVYRRGIERILWPTTLVGQIDAGVGVKTGIDINGFKNRLGTYAPPLSTFVDPRFLSTMPPRRISDGLAEILKLGISVDSILFDLLRKSGGVVLSEAFQGSTPDGQRAAADILERAIEGMLGELAPNLYEDDSARAVYLGHTWSPAVEMASLRRSGRWPRRRRALLHGEAVALDMLIAAGISLDRGMLDKSQYELIAETTDALGLPLWDPLLSDDDLMSRGLDDTTRHRGGKQLAPLPSGEIGTVEFVNDITPSEVARAARRQRALCGGSAL